MATRKTRRRFSDEFKSEAVKLVKQSNRSMADLAMEIGINPKSIGEWAKRAEGSGQAIEDEKLRPKVVEALERGRGTNVDARVQDLQPTAPGGSDQSSQPIHWSRTPIPAR